MKKVRKLRKRIKSLIAVNLLIFAVLFAFISVCIFYSTRDFSGIVKSGILLFVPFALSLFVDISVHVLRGTLFETVDSD